MGSQDIQNVEAILFGIFPSAISKIIKDYAHSNCHVCYMYADSMRIINAYANSIVSLQVIQSIQHANEAKNMLHKTSSGKRSAFIPKLNNQLLYSSRIDT